MSNVVIPDFLLRNSKQTKLSELIHEYDERFNPDTRMIEGYDINRVELEKMFERCLKENRTLFDVLGYYPDDLEEDEEI